MIDIHRALNGVAAQVQGTDIAFFGNADFGQVGLGGAQAAVGVSWHRVVGSGGWAVILQNPFCFQTAFLFLNIVSDCRIKKNRSWQAKIAEL